MRSFWHRFVARLQEHPEALLALASFWLSTLPLWFWMLLDPRAYRSEMWPGAILLLVALFLLGWLHPLLYLIAALGVGFLNAAYMHTDHFWRIGDLSVRIETTLDSSPGEAQEFFQQFVLRSHFAWGLIAYVLIALALGGLYWWARRQKPRRFGWATRLGITLPLVALLIGLGRSLLNAYPAVRLATTTYEVYTRVNRILERKDWVARALAEQPTLDCKAPYDHIVFVLGESANRDFMHAYGFDLPTTPFLDNLADKVLVRAISPVNQTMTSVPILLTKATVTDYDPYYTTPSIISDLRRCGYRTYWFSNQLRYSPYTSSVSSIASEADVVKFMTEELQLYGEPDEVLLQLFSPEEILPGQKQAFFFHLLGSHFEWKKRYPPEKALIPNPQDFTETYINSIYYTDQVLAEIFQLFQERSENLLFIYTSDHGEWITPKQGGHANAHPFQEEYRVPLVFWASHPEDLAPIAQATQGRLVNIETLNLQIRFLVSLEPDPGISYRTQVLSLGPGRIHDYTELPYVEYHETP